MRIATDELYARCLRRNRRSSWGAVVREVLQDSASQCTIHAVNLCEVYYDALITADEQTAEGIVADLKSSGVGFTEDMDDAFWREAARLKYALRKISLAECFAIVAARRADASILTSDHREFDPVAQQGVCRVRFIR